jgi:F0F1-type ATP synthase delta subunit
VISAIPLQDEAIKAIKKSFSEYQEIEINVTIDPKIIGGLKIAYDDKVFDASSQSLLNRLKQTISR